MRRALALVVVLVVSLVAPAGPALAQPWGWPLVGTPEVARPFDPPATRYGAGHRGVDLPAAPGSAVRAAAAGRVTYAGRLAGRGVVVVSHGQLRTTYEPVTATVRVGEHVTLGQSLGRLEPGHAGCAAAACLHWGLRRGEQYLDPVRLVRRAPIRLLPLDAAAPAGGGTRPQAAPAGSEPVTLAPGRVEEPSWSVRAAEAPLGAAALAALVIGIGLLTRPRPRPDDPASGGATGLGPAYPQEEPVGEPAVLLDLDEARARRQAAS